MSKTETKTNKLSPQFLHDVRQLADAVRGYLDDDSGSDGHFVLAMNKYVAKVERQLARAVN